MNTSQIDIALATKNRVSYETALFDLNEQTCSNNLNLFILDGNITCPVESFVNNHSWNFNSIKVYQESLVLGRRPPHWSIMYNFLFSQGNAPYISFWSDDLTIQSKSLLEDSLKAFPNNCSGMAFAFANDAERSFEVLKSNFGDLLTLGLICRKSFENLKGFNEEFSFWYADFDLSIRLNRTTKKIHSDNRFRVRNLIEGWANPNRVSKKDAELFQHLWPSFELKIEPVNDFI